ncbi:MAG: hypothetical protein U9Q69_02260 [Nanoarchaeota archaeon]|nr:hypothetical protein [Nanoarchaeota archaeon]
MGIFDNLLTKKKKEEPKKKIKKKEDNPLAKGKSNIKLKDGKDKYWVILESMTSGLEKQYFMILRLLREQPAHGIGFDEIIKVKDVFDASVSSSFHGHIGSKLSMMQQQASQHLATLGGMIKTVLPIVSELRKTDERLEYYEKSLKGDESAEISLKSIWIELVEQGMQNPNSVYALSTKVGYLSLPDLFFKINPQNGIDGVDKAIKSLTEEGIPKRVANVCAKKLFAYYTWKKQTYKELTFTKKFKLKYLRQHYNTIRMYMNWVRPYLKTIKQLQMEGKFRDADLINAFETAKIEIEILATLKKFKKYKPVIQVKFTFVSRPELIYTPQGQKQPVHAGRTEIEIRPYCVTQEQIDDYIQEQELNDLEILAALNESMMALKEDLKKYLEEAGEIFDENGNEKEEIKKRETIIDLFKPLGKGVADMFGSLGSIKISSKKEKQEALKNAKEKEEALKKAQVCGRLLYYIFKKATKLYTEI